jgi:hypothetical protein
MREPSIEAKTTRVVAHVLLLLICGALVLFVLAFVGYQLY